MGIVCSVCGGEGSFEPFTIQLQNRIVPLLAVGIVYFALAIVGFIAFEGKDYYHEIIAFAGTLIGSVTGYYFGGKQRAG